MINTVKGSGVVNRAQADVFLELSCFLDDPADVGNLISGSCAFFKSSLSTDINMFRQMCSHSVLLVLLCMFTFSTKDVLMVPVLHTHCTHLHQVTLTLLCTPHGFPKSLSRLLPRRRPAPSLQSAGLYFLRGPTTRTFTTILQAGPEPHPLPGSRQESISSPRSCTVRLGA